MFGIHFGSKSRRYAKKLAKLDGKLAIASATLDAKRIAKINRKACRYTVKLAGRLAEKGLIPS